MCTGLKRFFGQCSWILSSMIPPNLLKNRYFDTVINALFNYSSKPNLKIFKKKTPPLIVYSSQAFPLTAQLDLGSMTFPNFCNNR